MVIILPFYFTGSYFGLFKIVPISYINILTTTTSSDYESLVTTMATKFSDYYGI